MFSVVLTTLAKKQLSRLSPKIKERIIKTLQRCSIRPHAFAKKLVGSPYFSLRAGDYRIILDIQKNKLTILVLEMGHRKKIYKK